MWICSKSRWDFHFHYYVLTIYVCLYWILELIVFNSLVRRGYISKVSVQLVPKHFSRDCSTDSISCSEQKKREENKIKTRHQIKKGRSKRCCRRQSTCLIISLLSHRYCSVVAPILLRYRSVVAPLSHRYRTGIAPLLLRCCFPCCRYAVTPVSNRCRAVVKPRSLRPREGINN